MLWLRLIVVKVVIVVGVWFLHWFFKQFVHHVLRYYLGRSLMVFKPHNTTQQGSKSDSHHGDEEDDVIEICPHCGYPNQPGHRCGDGSNQG